MRYGLDVSKMKLPPWWPKKGPTVIPIKKGQGDYDWDVCKSKLPKYFYDELVANLRAYNPHGSEPPGFNESNIHKGGKIVTLPETP